MTDLTTARAEQWRALQPRRWRPWYLGAMLSCLAVASAASWFLEEGGCTVGDPCGPTWWVSFEFACLFAAPFVLALAPGPGLWFAGFSTAVFVVTEWPLRAVPRPLVVLLAVLVGVTALDALARRRRQEKARSALLRDVERASWPGPVPELRPWVLTERIAAGLAVLGVAVLVWGVQHGHDMAEREAAAPRVTATVVGHGDDGYLLDLEVDQQRFRVDSLDAEDYPIGSSQELVVDGERVTLAVERYDPAWALALVVALWLLGGCLAWRARQRRRALATLLGTPQPVHAVRLGALRHAQVLPVDGALDTTPLVAVPLVADVDDDEEEDEEEDEELPDPEVSAVGAQLFGVPVGGSWCAALLDDGTRLLPAGKLRRPDRRWPDVAAAIEAGGLAMAAIEVPADVSECEARLLRPRVWRWVLGAAVVIGSLVGAFLAARESSGLGATLWRCAIAASFVFQGLGLIARQVTLTDAALVLEGPTTRRTVPWSAVRDVSREDGVVLLHLDDAVVPLTWLPGEPWWRGRGRRERWVQDWAGVLAHRVRCAAADDATRVLVESRIAGAVLAVVFVAVVLLGLQVRP